MFSPGPSPGSGFAPEPLEGKGAPPAPTVWWVLGPGQGASSEDEQKLPRWSWLSGCDLRRDGLPPGEELCSYHKSQAHCSEGMEPRQHSLTLTATVSNLTRVVRKAQKCSFGDFE